MEISPTGNKITFRLSSLEFPLACQVAERIPAPLMPRRYITRKPEEKYLQSCSCEVCLNEEARDPMYENTKDDLSLDPGAQLTAIVPFNSITLSGVVSKLVLIRKYDACTINVTISSRIAFQVESISLKIKIFIQSDTTLMATSLRQRSRHESRYVRT
jgi:hypothetical protein